jgi:hypothetical protein
MDSCMFESNPRWQTALAWACTAAGVALAAAAYHGGVLATGNGQAGFLLGVLLIVIGVCALFATGKQTIVIDRRSRLITVEDINRFSRQKRLIHFADIVGTAIGYLGRRSTYVTMYFVILKLKTGEEYALFAPGRFFAGSANRAVMESRRQTLEEWLKR